MLAAGGENAGGPLNLAQIFEPSRRSFRAVGLMRTGRDPGTASMPAGERVKNPPPAAREGAGGELTVAPAGNVPYTGIVLVPWACCGC